MQDFCNYRGSRPMLHGEKSHSDQCQVLKANSQQCYTSSLRRLSSWPILSVYLVNIPLEYLYYPMNELLVHVRKHCMRQMQFHNVQDESAPICKGDFKPVE